MPASLLSGTYTNSLSLSNASNTIAGNGSGLTQLNAQSISTGTLDRARLPTNWQAGGDLMGSFPSPTIAALAVTDSKIRDVSWSKLMGIPFQVTATEVRTMRGWGANFLGQTTVPVPPAGITYTAASSGYAHTLGLRSDGSVVAWGWNTRGQCNVPPLPAGLTYVAVAAGSAHSLGLRNDGSVVGWGGNNQGQINVTAPPAGMTYVAVAAGKNAQCRAAERWPDRGLGREQFRST